MSSPSGVLSAAELPPGLRELERPPQVLYFHGSPPRPPIVAMVGTRYPSKQGVAFAESIAREVSSAGVMVASGGAEGIDTAVHRGALEGAGRTLVVAPSGFRRPYPEMNKELFERVVRRGGSYVSEFDSDVSAQRHHFFRRNSLLVAMSSLVIVVEAPLRSGARNAALWGRRLGRPVLVVAHSPWNTRGTAWIVEHRLGATLISHSRDVLELLSRRNEHAVGIQGSDDAPSVETVQLGLPLATGSEPERILAALRVSPQHLDDLVRLTGLSADRVQVVVVDLMMDSRVRLNSAGVVSLTG